MQRSLERLQTDHIDVMQIHGVTYGPDQIAHVQGPVLEALTEAKARGLIRHVGITGEESWTLIPFLTRPEIEVYQISYNIIQQAPGRFFLAEAARTNPGIVTMRTMTSGMFQHQMDLLAPGWQQVHDLYEVSLKFVLSDSRVHCDIVGMRWPDEVRRNLDLIRDWPPPFDFADLPRTTLAVYQRQDVAVKPAQRMI